MVAMVVVVCAALAAVAVGGTGDWTMSARLSAHNAAQGDGLGNSVALDGDTLAVGARRDDNGKGSVYIYRRNAATGEWEQEQRIGDASGERNHWFGQCVSTSGGWLVAGADGKNINTGEAFMWQRNDEEGTWGRKQTLAPTTEYAAVFGYACSMDGERMIVSAFQDDAANLWNSGSAFMYNLEEGRWNLLGKIQAADPDAGALFGKAVGISGSWAIVGAPERDVDSPFRDAAGAVYLFEYDAGQQRWFQRRKLQPGGLGVGDFFGKGVGIDGTAAVVGAPGTNTNGRSDAGAAYTFVFDGETWVYEQKLTARDPGGLEEFGESVAISGDRLVIGIPGLGRGAVAVFSKASGSWEQDGALLVSGDGQSGDFGDAVAILGLEVGIGAPRDDLAAVDAGAAFVFAREAPVETESESASQSQSPSGTLHPNRPVLEATRECALSLEIEASAGAEVVVFVGDEEAATTSYGDCADVALGVTPDGVYPFQANAQGEVFVDVVVANAFCDSLIMQVLDTELCLVGRVERPVLV